MAEFKASLSGAAPAPDLDAPLAALWWAAKGDWDQAHKIVQDEADALTPPGCMPICTGSKAISAMPATGTGRPASRSRQDALEAEWERIVSALLEGEGA